MTQSAKTTGREKPGCPGEDECAVDGTGCTARRLTLSAGAHGAQIR